MSDTIRLMKDNSFAHLKKWQVAYLRWGIYVLALVLPNLISEFRSFAEFSHISPVQWACLMLECAYQAVIVTRSFLDKTATAEPSAVVKPQQ